MIDSQRGSLFPPNLPEASRRGVLAALLAGLAAAGDEPLDARRRKARRHAGKENGRHRPADEDVKGEKKKKKKKGKKGKNKKSDKTTTSTTPAPYTTQPPTGGAGGLLSPVPAGVSYRVHHGYNDPLPGQNCAIGSTIDHCQNQQYGLDLDTVSRDIVAPGAGTVMKLDGDCLILKLDEGGVNMNLCHFAQFKVAKDQHFPQGYCLGTKGSHIHISLDDRYSAANGAKPPVPFTGRYKLDGKDLQPDGSQNQWNDEPFLSTNPGFCSAGGPASLRIEAAVRGLTVDRTNGNVLDFRPVHPTISAEVQLQGASGTVTLHVDVTYNASAGAYIGVATLPNQVTPGPYGIAVKFRDRTRTLRAQVPGFVTIRAGATTSIPRVTLTPADANDDDRVTTADYDLIASCYTFPGNPETCSGDRFKAADVDDSGTVNEYDLNLYTRVYT